MKAIKIFVVSALMPFLICSCEEAITGTFPQGEYPLELIAGMSTRSSGKDVWELNDSIGVSFDGLDAVGKYYVSDPAKGTVSSKSPLYWPDDETRMIVAWYPYDNMADVDVTIQAGHSRNCDFLRAETKASYDQGAVALDFKHLMSRVVVRVRAGEEMSVEDLQKAGVRFLGSGRVSFAQGTISSDNTVDDEIMPRRDGQDGDEVVYSALVYPKKMDGRKFIKVFSGDKSYYYVPAEGKADLKGGCQYEYIITLRSNDIDVEVVGDGVWNDDGTYFTDGDKKDVFVLSLSPEVVALDGLSVYAGEEQCVISGDKVEVPSQSREVVVSWNTGNTTYSVFVGKGVCDGKRTFDQVSGRMSLTISNVCTDLSLEYDEYVTAGDYYFADGSWGPTSPLEGKEMIGRVFYVGIGPGDRVENYSDKGMTRIRGYVAGREDFPGGGICWGGLKDSDNQNGAPLNFNVEEIPDIDKTSQYSDFYGYKYYRIIMDKYLTDPSKYSFPLFEACANYRYKAPDGTSGWYIPSLGQLAEFDKIKIVSNLVLHSCDEIDAVYNGQFWYSSHKTKVGMKNNADARYLASGRPVLTF